MKETFQNWILVCLQMVLVIDITSAGLENKAMPMSVMMRMKDVKSTQEFFRDMIQPPSPGSIMSPAQKNLFGKTETGSATVNEGAVENLANAIASPAVCDPKPTAVEIPQHADPRVIYWPTCTTMDRCGGCCGMDLLECGPTSIDHVNVKVMKTMISGVNNDRYDYLGTVDIQMERHRGCECRCKVKAEHCDASIQYYDATSCQCKCRSSGLATSCTIPKQWDEKLCRCICPRLVQCLDDEYFSYQTCSCQKGIPQSNPGGLSLNPNPCAAHRCRSGFTGIMSGGRCTCTRGRRRRQFYQ